ncbi:acetate--CoA ligase family protein [Pseudodesulfovibrio senegalensis]|uniref:CoA-binding protein n=1 Tax=Pseudodesulfovibrio senegalensis TaxID=1721087 RepID=A0A6N6N2D3_9BACT|nr:acetate--CoA ligase [Pseudodesulfovibrio senegalensis]KAB1441548.1 CoA-binding protein [Pseudodesulfovibrio senegalensis]
MNENDNLRHFFEPHSVAVVGASATEGKIGHSVLSNMLAAGYKGRLIPVNPKGGQILGLDVVQDMEALPSRLDLAVICLPRDMVLPALEQLAARKCASVIVITAGFKEVGREGYRLEEKMAELCRESNMALLGPNCLGMINAPAGVNASFAANMPAPGNIAFFSQSGALCVAILDWATGAGIGFSKFVSLGNKAVLDEADMLRHLNRDEQTRVILGYVENVENGEEFMRQARIASRNKPVIMIKSGITAAGAKAASSHTGAIAGSDQAYDTAFRKSGIIRVGDVETLFNLARAFAEQPLPKGPGVAVVTNSGGPGIIAADVVERSSLGMASFQPHTVQRLQEFLPSYAAFYNPVDIIADADADRYRRALEVVAEDPMVHSLVVVLTPTGAVDIEKIAEAVIHVSARYGKPVFAVFMGSRRVARARDLLRAAGIPCYGFPEPAVHSVEAMYEYGLWQRRPESTVPVLPKDTAPVRRLIDESLQRGENEVVEFRAREVLEAYGLPTPQTRLARSSDEAVAAADAIGYPVALKIASPQISHKTDVDGVRVHLKTADHVAAAFQDITARAQRMRPDAYLAGCLVQAMAPADCREVIVGFHRDEQFGPLLMFGLGGIYVEILKDIAFRLVPLTTGDAHDIVREIKSYMLLKGLQGERPVNFEALEGIILAMSQLAADFPEILEAEFNPVLVNSSQAIIADVRLTLSSGGR